MNKHYQKPPEKFFLGGIFGRGNDGGGLFSFLKADPEKQAARQEMRKQKALEPSSGGSDVLGTASSLIGFGGNVIGTLTADDAGKENLSDLDKGVSVASSLASGAAAGSALGPIGAVAGGVIGGGIAALDSFLPGVDDQGVGDFESGGGYAGIEKLGKDAAKSSLSRRLFGRRRQKAKIAEAARLQSKTQGILNEAEDRRELQQNMSQIEADRYLQDASGLNYYAGSATVGKEGMPIHKRVKVIARNYIVQPSIAIEEIQEAQKFMAGGKVNKIADGVLHARKNNLKANVEYKNADITTKGVPVISHEDGGEIIQHAEIEKSEIIFAIETTKEIERLISLIDSTEDNEKKEIFIELGQFMTDEILNNTEDNKDKILKKTK